MSRFDNDIFIARNVFTLCAVKTIVLKVKQILVYYQDGLVKPKCSIV